ncbi:YkvA family protein [Bacillus sp. T33-2]|uniref:YkvA family protein n=1 Tax=Bacillus sp. T33-2 TaxID=2054168 RepID=UPI000C780E3E|nr:DUF1232 domain-containing protein [Bacillus sp. T33-2]PLR94149.1 hypothetical protein CVD19_17870 [Bacillus sp. T33-2]
MRKFLNRIRLVFKVKKFLPFLAEFFTSREVDIKKKLLSVGLIVGYFLLPFDLVPDFLAVIGIFDDVGIMLLILQQIIKMAPINLREKYQLLK